MNPIETHEKYLAWIDEEIRKLERFYPFGSFGRILTHEIPSNSLRANRKVLERHGPIRIYRTQDFECAVCPNEELIDTKYPFPCLTYVDVRDGLGIER